MGETYDVIIVGSGATGLWAAKELTSAGMQVLLLDAGERHEKPSPISPPQQEAESESSEDNDWLAVYAKRQPIQSRNPAFNPDTAKLFVDDIDNPYITLPNKPFEWFRVRGIGGRTLVGARALLRFSDNEFKAATRDGFGQDWPLSYRDLEPFYDQVETALGIMGSHEGLSQLPDSKYRLLAELSPTAQRFKRAVEARWPERRVIPARLLVGDYAELLAVARQTGRLVVRSGAIVHRILIDSDTARASGVAFIDRATHRAGEVRAPIVVLSASTIESTRILLNSATRQHPNGLGNSAGLLGHYLMDHTVANPALVIGTYEVHPTERAPLRPVILPNFRNLDSRRPDFLRGYFFQCIGFDGGPDPVQMFTMQAFGEVLPHFENRVTIDPVRKDAWGIPVPRIEYHYGENEARMAKDQRETATEILRCAGIDTFVVNPALAAPGYSLHEVGTARMGDHPKNSVLDPFCSVWDVPNLFVIDGSCFVSAGHQNPTLTMMALTGRACARIIQLARTGQRPASKSPLASRVQSSRPPA